MSKKNKKFGLCKLTGNQGKFVKAHIIAKGLMPKIIREEPFMQPLEDGKSKKSQHGLCDSTIVTREGEDFFSELDSWAISRLRETKLVWEGWGSDKKLISDDLKIFSDDFGIRKNINIDTKKFRIFCLSLLWRAAASNLSELSGIKLPKNDLEKIGSIITSGNADSPNYYPIVLTQFHTRHIGDTHLCLPVKDVLPYKIKEGKSIELPFYRFYFDGLIIHIYIDNNLKYGQEFGSLIIGSGENMSLLTKSYESSRELEFYRNSLDEHINKYLKRKNNKLLSSIKSSLHTKI